MIVLQSLGGCERHELATAQVVPFATQIHKTT